MSFGSKYVSRPLDPEYNKEKSGDTVVGEAIMAKKKCVCLYETTSPHREQLDEKGPPGDLYEYLCFVDC